MARDLTDEANRTRRIALASVWLVHSIAAMAQRSQNHRIIGVSQMNSTHAHTVGLSVNCKSIFDAACQKTSFGWPLIALFWTERAKKMQLNDTIFEEFGGN